MGLGAPPPGRLQRPAPPTPQQHQIETLPTRVCSTSLAQPLHPAHLMGGVQAAEYHQQTDDDASVWLLRAHRSRVYPWLDQAYNAQSVGQARPWQGIKITKKQTGTAIRQ